jgi:hypothetical protein
MTTGDTQTGTKERPKFEKDFKELPLDEKLGSLFRMEAAALEETFHVVADASVKAFNKAAEVLDDLGTRVSEEYKARCAANEASANTAEPAATSTATPKSGPKKKNPKPNVNG